MIEQYSFIEEVQLLLESEQLDGWLIYDFRGSNPFARKILALSSKKMFTRRFFYFIPKKGTPRKLVHKIEENNLDELPGDKIVYSCWKSFEEGLEKILKTARKVAMEYSPRCVIPYVSHVDAGIVELVRSFGVEVASSANLVQYFEARCSEEQLNDHIEAASHLREIVDRTFYFIKDKISSNIQINEYDVQQYILSEFQKRGLITSSEPNCSVNANSANPHYEPDKETHIQLKKGDFVLIDLWAKKNKPGSVYADVTWVGFIGRMVPSEYQNIFEIVKYARNSALGFIQKSFKQGKTIRGFEVDDVARNCINEYGMGEYFVHRTGHSLGEEVHGNGANLDNFETKDERVLIPGTAFTIEPGIYLPGKFGVRSEINLYISNNRDVVVTGLPMQEHIKLIS